MTFEILKEKGKILSVAIHLRKKTITKAKHIFSLSINSNIATKKCLLSSNFMTKTTISEEILQIHRVLITNTKQMFNIIGNFDIFTCLRKYPITSLSLHVFFLSTCDSYYLKHK